MTADRGPDTTLAKTVDLALCRELVELTREQALLEEKAKLIGKEISAINTRLYPQLVGRKSQSLEGGAYVMPKRSVLVSKRGGVSTEEAVATLKRNDDLAWLVREDYQPGKLREFVNEQDKAAIDAGDPPDTPSELLPEDLRSCFQVIEKTSVTVGGGIKARAKADATAERRKEVDSGGERKAD